jgi:hypothetical protein
LSPFLYDLSICLCDFCICLYDLSLSLYDLPICLYDLMDKSCKHDWGRIRPVQILWSITLKLQIGKDDDKKESKYQKYIY